MQVMERQDIEVFLTLAEELHFARTAQRLRLAPASISQTIKKLERRFGAPLFTRTTRRVDLTPLGRQLRDDLSPAYAQVQAAIAAATTAGRGETGELRLGYMSAAVARRLLALVDTVRSHTRRPGQHPRDHPGRPVRTAAPSRGRPVRAPPARRRTRSHRRARAAVRSRAARCLVDVWGHASDRRR